MSKDSQLATRRSRGAGRKAASIACAVVACLLAISLLSCRKEDFGLLIMAGYGVLDRISLSRDKPIECDDEVKPYQPEAERHPDNGSRPPRCDSLDGGDGSPAAGLPDG